MSTANTIPHEILLKRLRSYLDRYFDLDHRIESFQNRRFYSLEVELTNKCNRECAYCYNCSSRHPAFKDLPFEAVMELLEQAAEYGIRSIGWLGGEPTLYSRLEEVLRRSKELGIENVLFTNGSLLTGKLWKSIGPGVDRMMFHLDTVDENTFIHINEIPPPAARSLLAITLRNLNGILASGFDPDRISLYVVLLRPTFLTLKQTLDWAINDNKLGTVTMYPMVRAGRALKTLPDAGLTKEELKRAFEMRAQCENRPELLLLGPSEYCKHYQLTMAYVQVDGEVTPYAGVPGGYGNILTNSLGKILEAHYEPLSFSRLVSMSGLDNTNVLYPCKLCPNCSLCFGTRTSALNELGLINSGDPFCWMEVA